MSHAAARITRRARSDDCDQPGIAWDERAAHTEVWRRVVYVPQILRVVAIAPPHQTCPDAGKLTEFPFQWCKLGELFQVASGRTRNTGSYQFRLFGLEYSFGRMEALEQEPRYPGADATYAQHTEPICIRHRNHRRYHLACRSRLSSEVDRWFRSDSK